MRALWHWFWKTQQGLRRTRRARTPTVLQMEAVECGAAALASVLGFHGRFVLLEELRVACGVSRDGTKASNIVKAARKYGLKAKGFSKEPADLALLPLPMIVFWNFNHFVVVEGIAGNRVFINDPASGPRSVSTAEFDQAFTGVVLVFERAPDFTQGGSKRSLAAALRKRLSGLGAPLAFVILAGLALVIPGFLVPVFLRVFVDYCLVAKMTGWVGPLLIGMGLTVVMRAALTWLQQEHLLRCETRLALATSYRFFRHVLRLPLEFFSQRYAGEIGSRVEINDEVACLLSRDLARTVLNVFMAVFFVAFMFSYDVVLTVVGLIVAGCNLAALRYVSRKRVDLNQRLLQERAKLTGTTMAGLEMIETIKAGGAESDFFAKWAGHLAKAMNAEQQMGLYNQVLHVVPSLLAAVNATIILAVGSLRVMDGHLTIGMLVAFQSLMFSFLGPVTELVYLGGTLQEVDGEMKRLDDVLHHRTDPGLTDENPSDEEHVSVARLAGQLELRNIAFGYSLLDAPLLHDINFTARPGERVAILGTTGSGKSTVVKLVSGLFQPWQGEVLFDGKPRSQIQGDVITNSLAMVDQEIFLFEGSIREILTMWDATLPEANLIQAAKDACIHEEIAARPGGYDSPLKEGGSNFSGGQRQRLEIARALVSNPAILVLDEATSALDPITEKRIEDNLRRRGCTCLIIAHRLSTIRDCDEIIVLDRGRIVQRGNHDALSKVQGPYRQMINA